LKLISKYTKSDFLKNVLTLASGTAIAQIIPFIIAPLLTRLYLPENFGELGVIMAVIGVFSIVATLQYESAIMLPEDDIDGFNLLALSFVLSFFIGIISWVIIVLFSEEIGVLFGLSSLGTWSSLVPVFVMLTGFYRSMNIWSSRKKMYKELAFRNVGQSLVQGLSKLGFGIRNYLSVGLVLGTLMGQLTSTSVLAIQVYRKNSFIKDISWKRMISNAKKYSNFPKYTLWQGFLDIAKTSGVIFILSLFFGLEVVGFYTFAVSMLMKPSTLIGRSVSQVFYQKASQKFNRGKSILPDVKGLIYKLLIIGIIMFTPFVIFGPTLFSIIFGENWEYAGVFARLISPWLLARFVFSPFASITNILGVQREFLLLSIIYNLLVPLILFVLLSIDFYIESVFLVMSFFVVIYVIFMILWLRGIIVKIESKK
jgi:O-antigen/teichoic acid export membrane protein